MKKTLTAILAGMMVLVLAACQSNPAESSSAAQSSNASSTVEGNVQIPNPFQDCDNLGEASKIADFTVTAPQAIDSLSEVSYRAIEGKMIEIIYANASEQIRIRKAKDNGDISGVYEEFPENNTVKVGDVEVNTKGSDGDVHVATWVDGEYSYALVLDTKVGLDEVVKMIQTIK